jgi:hypothetical protein
MVKLLRLIGAFVILAAGTVLTLPLPEFGILLILVATRMLGDRFAWARVVNAKVDAGWKKVKAWLKKVFRR